MRAAKIAGILAGATAAVPALAMRADAAGFRLSLAQTRALYGDTLSGTYYDSTAQAYSDVSFDFVGYTTDWITDNEGQDGLWIPFYSIYNATGDSNAALTRWSKSAPAVVYEAAFPHGTFVPNSGDNNIANVELNTSVNITNIKHFDQQIWWSANLQPSYDGTNITDGLAWGAPGNSWGISNCSSPIGNVRDYAEHNGAYQVWQRAYTYGACRLYNPDDLVPSYYHAPFYAIRLRPVSDNNTDYFNYTGVMLHLNAVNYAVRTAVYDRVYLMIQCPEIDGEFVGPTMPVTTTCTTTTPVWTAQTAASYSTSVTIDNFADDIQEIIRNQRWQIYYDQIAIRNQMAINENLRIIINQLNDIYNAMMRSADVPINTGGSMWQEMVGALTGMTTNTMPNYVLQGLTFWADCSQEILIRYDFLVPLGAFALTMLVIYYVLFKGRTS